MSFAFGPLCFVLLPPLALAESRLFFQRAPPWFWFVEEHLAGIAGTDYNTLEIQPIGEPLNLREQTSEQCLIAFEEGVVLPSLPALIHFGRMARHDL